MKINDKEFLSLEYRYVKSLSGRKAHDEIVPGFGSVLQWKLIKQSNVTGLSFLLEMEVSWGLCDTKERASSSDVSWFSGQATVLQTSYLILSSRCVLLKPTE